MDKGGLISTDTVIMALGQHHSSSAFAVPHLINNLPLELIEQIFIDCTHTGVALRSFKLTRSPKWISITHVCRLWRQIALGCPRLWTHITPDLSSTWIAAFASRSKSVPLLVEIEVNHIANGTFQQHLSTNASRLRELSLGHDCDDEDVDEIASNLATTLSTPAPLLRSLVLDFDDIYLEEDLFGGYTPQLRRLWLGAGILVPPTSSLLPNLRYLKMRTVTSFAVTLMLLQQTPLLETLHMGNFDEQPDNQFPDNIHSIIRLPHLSHFSIRPNSVNTLIHLFELLRMPPTVHLEISFNADNMEVGHQWRPEFFRMLDIIGGHLRSTASETSAPLTQLNLYILPHSWIFKGQPGSGSAPHIHASQHLLREMHYPWHGRDYDPDCEFGFSFRYGFLDEGNNDVLLPMYHVQSMCDRMPLAHICALDLSIDLPMSSYDPSVGICRVQGRDPHTWPPILRLMPEVRVLTVSENTVIGILKALMPDTNTGLESPLFVHLTALIIERANVGCPDHTGNKHQGQDLLEVLEAFVSKRKEAGLELESILFKNCVCVEGIVDLLGGYVKDISWVGQRTWCRDGSYIS